MKRNGFSLSTLRRNGGKGVERQLRDAVLAELHPRVERGGDPAGNVDAVRHAERRALDALVRQLDRQRAARPVLTLADVKLRRMREQWRQERSKRRPRRF